MKKGRRPDIDTNGAAWTDEPVTPAPEDARRERAMDGAHHKSAGSGFGRPGTPAGSAPWMAHIKPGMILPVHGQSCPSRESRRHRDRSKRKHWLKPGRLSENPAVIALLDDTDLRISQGDAEGAVSSLNGPLRLEPRNPWLWHRLAVLRLRQGQWRQAIALAEKSNSLSVRHPKYVRPMAELIEQAEKR